jgi:hypothetical protein
MTDIIPTINLLKKNRASWKHISCRSTIAIITSGKGNQTFYTMESLILAQDER